MGQERCILLTFIVIVAAGVVGDKTRPSIPLNLIITTAPPKCIPGTLLFNYFASIKVPLEYLPTQVPNWNINIRAYVRRINVPGCSLQENTRASLLVKTLNGIVEGLNTSTGFSVLLGPNLGGECQFISTWIAFAGFSNVSYYSLYQLNYACRPENQHNFFTGVSMKKTEHLSASNSLEVCALYLPLPVQTLSRGLGTLLRYNGWSRLSVLYEVSSKETSYKAFGQKLLSLLSIATISGLTRLEVLHHGSLHVGSRAINALPGLVERIQGE
ncbi:unnamed protein product [Dibothriocephalus latus]|uniref:Receptor ligand binding region domain-containing protein n=1 Tax=Dibothriocephalus latus TaxID=60516 RepID=A0A3P7QE50_DIBLA|nr:unnamed protein product [Dibothriocephalus latus]